jgi:phage tail tape-measure protein
MGIQDALRNHPAVGGLVGGIAIGAGVTGIVNVVRKRRATPKTTTKRKSTTRRKTTKRTTKKSGSAFKKRRARAFAGASPKKIFFTKNGQPYIKLRSGKARFIKKSSARSRKKRKGGFS